MRVKKEETKHEGNGGAFWVPNFNMYGITREPVQYLWHFVPVPVPESKSEE